MLYNETITLPDRLDRLVEPLNRGTRKLLPKHPYPRVTVLWVDASAPSGGAWSDVGPQEAARVESRGFIVNCDDTVLHLAMDICPTSLSTAGGLALIPIGCIEKILME